VLEDRAVGAVAMATPSLAEVGAAIPFDGGPVPR
jgi:hypothetical protein